jgi:hypothetical protein
MVLEGELFAPLLYVCLYDLLSQTGSGADVRQRHAGHDQEEGGGIRTAPGDGILPHPFY